MATTSKLKLRYPVAGDPANALATYFANLANDVDNKLAHRALPYFGKPYVESGGALSNGGGLNAAVAAGVACINGITFDFAPSGNILMTASTTNHLWLTASFDGNGFLTGYVFAKRTDTVVPANSVYLGQVIAAGASLTSVVASFRGVIAPGKEIAFASRTTDVSSAVAGGGVLSAGLTIDVMGDGVTDIDFEAWGYTFYLVTTTEVDLRILSNTGGTTYVGAARNRAIVSGAGQQTSWPKGRLPAFVGLKSFILDAYAFQAGTLTFYSNGYQLGLRAKHAI